jgi:predicted TIM-barrel fold metal-dependent hydrolase
MIPIVDAHHHIWRQVDLPWLQGPIVPRIFGPYEAIRRDYLITEYLADIASSGVVRSIYVQANWPKDNAIEEANWVQSVSDQHGWPHGIVAYADLLSESAGETLIALAKIPKVRGIRMQLHWHENPLYRFAAAPDLMTTAVFRKNFKYLEDLGLTFDLQVFEPQMKNAARLAADFPEVKFILQHAGMLADPSREGILRWREGMQILADQPNIYCKLSGLGTFIQRNDFTHIADVIETTVAIFGASRCMFGSNFPIEKIWTKYTSLVSAYRAALGTYSLNDQKLMLHDNAIKVYKLDTSKG